MFTGNAVTSSEAVNSSCSRARKRRAASSPEVSFLIQALGGAVELAGPGPSAEDAFPDKNAHPSKTRVSLYSVKTQTL